MDKKRIGIIGASGYTGSELVRLLVRHPDVEIVAITSESRAGEKFSDVHTFFRGIVDTKLIKAAEAVSMELDLVFLALPHGVSMDFVKEYSKRNIIIIDLSGDFRLDNAKTYSHWYERDHTFEDGFERAVYGLPELFPDEIRSAGLIANPGCSPTSVILGLAPLVKNSIVDVKSIIVDSKTGVSGAGVKASPVTHFPNVNDNVRAYGLKKHRHTIEMQQQLNAISSDEVILQFTPHLIPVDRGILSSIYARPVVRIDIDGLRKQYRDFYRSMPFVRICDTPPSIKDVRASNYCDIFVDFDERTNNIIVLAVIDNLVKGAAGQAIQNMNLVLGFDEASGLNPVPLNP